jgi:hypothetical protein
MKKTGSMRTLSRIFKALSDETRLAIMALVLRHGHLCVCEVEQILGITQSKASRHLRYLGTPDCWRTGGTASSSTTTYRKRPIRTGTPSGSSWRSSWMTGSLPQAGPLLVQIRDARLRGDPASSVEALAP